MPACGFAGKNLGPPRDFPPVGPAVTTGLCLSETVMDPQRELHPLEVSCRDAQVRLNGDADVFLLDCREQDEFDLVKIESSELLPMSEIVQRSGELEPHRGREIIVYCHHGARSLRVTAWLHQQGYTTARSLAGGIDRWASEIDPSLPRY